MDTHKGLGRAIFAATLLGVGGVLNVVYGIAGIGDSNFFVNDVEFIFGSLKTWGWLTLLLGIIQLVASVSLINASAFGRYFGIFAAGLSAVGALLAIPAYPLWSIAIFALDLFVIHGLAIYGSEERAARP